MSTRAVTDRCRMAAGVYSDSLDRLLSEIDRSLADGARREVIRRRAHERVARERTHTHRARAIGAGREPLP
jgi:hypothetical protein